MKENDKVHSSWFTRLLENSKNLKTNKLYEDLISNKKITIKIGSKTYIIE